MVVRVCRDAPLPSLKKQDMFIAIYSRCTPSPTLSPRCVPRLCVQGSAACLHASPGRRVGSDLARGEFCAPRDLSHGQYAVAQQVDRVGRLQAPPGARNHVVPRGVCGNLCRANRVQPVEQSGCQAPVAAGVCVAAQQHGQEPAEVRAVFTGLLAWCFCTQCFACLVCASKHNKTKRQNKKRQKIVQN